jgi:hypothetical protein
MTTRNMTSERWNGYEWITVVSAIEVPAPRDEAADRAEFLASCDADERAEAEAFFALADLPGTWS